MATVFGASLSPMEREAQLIFMECDMTASKIEAIQDITNAQYDRAIMAAEYTVLKTGGTYDDLDRLMMEAAAQQGEKKVGIIRTILNSIGSAISSIGNWIQRNLGANNDRLNGLPANAQGDVDGYDLKAANEGLTGLPKVFNKLKEIIKSINACIQGNKEFAVASIAVAAVAAVLVKGSKEEQEAKEEPITQVNKETVQDMLNRFLKLQGTANELTGEVDTLLKKLGLPMKALKAKAEDIATKKNAKRAEKDAQASGNGGGDQQAQPETASAPIDHVAGDNMMESTEAYGLGAYDELFMESKRKNRNNKNQQGNQKTNNNTNTGAGATNGQSGNQQNQQSSGTGSTGGQANTGTANAQTGNQQNQQGNQTKKTGTANGQSDQASAASSTSGSTSGQANTGTANAQTGNQQNQQSSGTGSTGSTGTANGQSGNQQNQQAQASGSTGEQKTDANAQGNNGDNAQTEEKQESEFSKLPWYDKAITALQATLETMLALVAATGKSVLNIVAKVIQWDKIKAGANKLEQRVMDGRGNGKDDNANQSNEGNDQQQTADNTGNGDANADNGSEAAHDDTVTGDYTTESPDLFGIHDEYNEMMESPSMEELNSFEAIFDNL